MLDSGCDRQKAQAAREPFVKGPCAESRPISQNGSEVSRLAKAQPASIEFRKAVKYDAKLRFAACGPSGSGKTYTLLKLAIELGGPVSLIDTEHGSASKYADLFEFDVLELDSYDPARLIEIIDYCAQRGYRVLCIDSLSHFWMGKDGELDRIDRAAQRMQNQNGFAAWKQVTPLHNALIHKIVSAPIHILASMRAKTDWVLDRDERTGRTVPRKVGLAPVMRDGIEYEFDVCGDMDQENTLVITKTRCPSVAGGIFPKPGKELAQLLKDWLVGPPPELAKNHERAAPEENTNGRGVATDVAVAPNNELAAIWKRMCSPRGVAEEFQGLKASIDVLAGSTGVADFYAILRKHGVSQPRQFRSMQPARLCAKDVYILFEQLRASQGQNPELKPASSTTSAETFESHSSAEAR